MSMNKDDTIEIAQVGNGFIVRQGGAWFGRGDHDSRVWANAKDDHLVFRTMTELQAFLAEHFTHRAKVALHDAAQSVKVEKKAA